MQSLPNLEMTKDELDFLLECPYSVGGEAIICPGGRLTLLKLFVNHHLHEQISGNDYYDSRDLLGMSENKLKKLEVLYQKKPQGLVKPLRTLTLDKKLIGYEMTKEIGAYQYAPKALKVNDNIAILTQSGKILRGLSQLDMTYGDVNPRNILVNATTKEVTFCDIDNMRIGDYPIDIMDKELYEYGEMRAYDQTADAYMHNLLTLYSLTNKTSNDEVLEMLKQGQIPNIFNRRGRKIIESMITPETFTGEYAIQYIKNAKSYRKSMKV